MSWDEVVQVNTAWSDTTPGFSNYVESFGRYLLGGPGGVNYAFSDRLRFGGANVPDDPTTTDWS